MNAPLGDSPQDLAGLNVVDADGGKVGSVQQVYRDDATNAPEWITVRTGLFGMKETFVPLAGARRADDALQVPYTKDQIKDAPRMDADGHLDPAEEEELYAHYGLTRRGNAGMGRGESAAAAGGAAGAAGTAAAAGGGRHARHEETTTEKPMAGTGTGQRDMAMSRGAQDPSRESRTQSEQVPDIVLNEERVNIGTEEHESGRAHLRKTVVTENVSRTVPISHEEVRMTREKISDEDRARMGRGESQIGEAGKDYEIVLHEERAVVSKETVPVERVHLETRRVTEQQEVNAEVRKEQLEFDDGTGERKGRRKGAPGPDSGAGSGR
ncbi:PRC and DUF2382 domain-containing protein [Streptomyces physcomitrii]|uniref:PRC and DUF2382 domain-containing protein n=1 Tax=Streptomyces physcomitrii TaxID=2724184 RepID=A0ABX1H2B8_9ACTN|nr:PRC and DUF2382 domain-containing protein [Streptomyces physcomitrii]NKI41440.1 PRC and DUF2382 domain-containing protein [Streptomyces physcomitrii]